MTQDFYLLIPPQCPDQEAVIADWGWVCVAYEGPLIIESDKGTWFTGALVQ